MSLIHFFFLLFSTVVLLKSFSMFLQNNNFVTVFHAVVNIQFTSCRSIVGRNMLRAFGHRVAMCCDMLGVNGSSLKMVKFEPTTPNKSQHVATGWPNAHNMLRPTMSRHVALACCDSLVGD